MHHQLPWLGLSPSVVCIYCTILCILSLNPCPFHEVALSSGVCSCLVPWYDIQQHFCILEGLRIVSHKGVGCVEQQQHSSSNEGRSSLLRRVTPTLPARLLLESGPSFDTEQLIALMSTVINQRSHDGSDSHGHATIGPNGSCTIRRMPRSL